MSPHDPQEKSGTSKQDTGSAVVQAPARPQQDLIPHRTRVADVFVRAAAAFRRTVRGAWGTIRGFTQSIRAWARSSTAAVAAKLEIAAQRLYGELALLPLRARFHFRHYQTRYFRWFSVVAFFFTILGGWAGIGLWPSAMRYCARLKPSTFEQVATALGAAVAGLLAIVFALTTFAIQQVAARETAEVVLEYARDRRMASTYWVLAAIATTYFILPFLSVPGEFLPTELALLGGLLVLTFLLIYRHFKIVMLYSDPRFTVDRLHRKGIRELRNVAKTVDRVKRTVRNRRSDARGPE